MAVTSTEVVPSSSSTTLPSSTSTPFTWNTARDVSVFGSTIKLNVNVWVVSPSAAVTVTTSSLSPNARSVPPEISTFASESVVSTSTSTSVVNGSSSITSPSTTVAPLIEMLTTDASLFRATFKVTVYSCVLPSAAVTVTTNVFSPLTSSAPPAISYAASVSLASTSI